MQINVSNITQKNTNLIHFDNHKNITIISLELVQIRDSYFKI